MTVATTQAPTRATHLSATHLYTLDACRLVPSKCLQHLPHTDAHAAQTMQDWAVKANSLRHIWVNVQRVVVSRQPVRGQKQPRL